MSGVNPYIDRGIVRNLRTFDKIEEFDPLKVKDPVYRVSYDPGNPNEGPHFDLFAPKDNVPQRFRIFKPSLEDILKDG